MADMTLVIADKNYCLWPLPAWLCLRKAGLDFVIRIGVNRCCSMAPRDAYPSYIITSL